MFLFSMGKISSFFQLFLSNETARDGGEQIHTHTHTHIIVKFTRLERHRTVREIRVNSLSVSLSVSLSFETGFFKKRLTTISKPLSSLKVEGGSLLDTKKL